MKFTHRLANLDELCGTRFRMRFQLALLRPAIGLVMMVDVQQDVDIPAARLEYDAPPVTIQPN